MESTDILKLIAEGYFSHSEEDRLVFIHNPKYRDGTIDGEVEDPYILWEVWKEENE